LILLVWHFTGQHKKKMKPPDSASDDHGDWQGVVTSKVPSHYSPETMERFSAFHSVKREVIDVQEPPIMLSR